MGLKFSGGGLTPDPPPMIIHLLIKVNGLVIKGPSLSPLPAARPPMPYNPHHFNTLREILAREMMLPA